MEIHPIELVGSWDKGYALDVYTVSSEHVGNDVYGRPLFNNLYSDMGELIYQFKYRYQYDKLFTIIALLEQFIESWIDITDVNYVLPVPPSNRYRSYQPAEEIAKETAKLIGAGYSNDILCKISTMESKGLLSEDKEQIRGSIVKKVMAKKEHNTLLIDDVFKSGTTMDECVRVLRKDPMIKSIYVLTMTKTRT